MELPDVSDLEATLYTIGYGAATWIKEGFDPPDLDEAGTEMPELLSGQAAGQAGEGTRLLRLARQAVLAAVRHRLEEEPSRRVGSQVGYLMTAVSADAHALADKPTDRLVKELGDRVTQLAHGHRLADSPETF